MSDEFFAEQRLSGANPMIMKKLEKDDARVEVLEQLDLKFNLNSELSKGNVYVCDYTGTDPDYRGPVTVAVWLSSISPGINQFLSIRCRC
ncbi:MAG: hypothetical protein HC767_03070 [Akkermansiaceae bacterium]|nr:hypothetical protein [Akkermansiaceae bacterium]